MSDLYCFVAKLVRHMLLLLFALSVMTVRELSQVKHLLMQDFEPIVSVKLENRNPDVVRVHINAEHSVLLESLEVTVGYLRFVKDQTNVVMSELDCYRNPLGINKFLQPDQVVPDFLVWRREQYLLMRMFVELERHTVVYQVEFEQAVTMILHLALYGDWHCTG